MKSKAFQIFCILFILFLLGTSDALAGFGVTPPYVYNKQLSRGASYVQEINIIRGEDTEDQIAKIEIDVPGANDWITIGNGEEFMLPAGEKKVTMEVIVNVPKKAKFGEYRGAIHLSAEPTGKIQEGVVSIVLGMQIDVTLDVIEQNIFEYTIQNVKILDAEAGHDFLFWYIPAKLKMILNLKNLGNVKAAPDWVTLDVYEFNDFQREKIIESLENYNKLEKVPPFLTKDVEAKFKLKLPASVYRGYYKVYKGDEVINEGEVILSIMPRGEINKGLPFWAWIIIIILIVAGLFFSRKYLLRFLRKIKKKK